MGNQNTASAEPTPGSLLNRLLQGAWLLVVVLPPLFVNVWGQQPFELPKAALLRTLIWLIFLLEMVVIWRSGDSLTRRLRVNPLGGPLLILAVALIVTTLTAVDWRLSWWGSHDRAQGTITLLSYLLLCLLAVNRGRQADQGRPLATAMALTSVPLLLIALAQAAGFGWPGLVSDGNAPVYATLGRSNFLGAYLALLLPLTLGLALLSRDRPRRVAWLALLMGQLAVVGLTLARSAWLAAAVGLALFALLWCWPNLRRRTTRLIGYGSLIAIPAAVAGFALLAPQATGSLAARLTIWRATLQLVTERPLLGYGADALDIVFPRVFPPELVYYQGREFLVDRAHNFLLDWAVTAGLPGLLAFAFVVLTFVVVVVRALRREQTADGRVMLIALIAAVSANLVNNLLSFDVTATASAFWLLMGLGAGLAVPAGDPVPARAPMPRAGIRLAGGLACGVVLASIWAANWRPVRADMAARQAVILAAAGDGAEAIAAAEHAVAAFPVEPAHLVLLGKLHRQQVAGGGQAAAQHLARAESALLTARQLRPEDPALWMETAVFYAAAGQHQGETALAAAEAAFQQAIRRAPNQADYYLVWAYSLTAWGKDEEAAAALRQATALDATNGAAFLLLGDVETQLRNTAKARAAYGEAAQLRPHADMTAGRAGPDGHAEMTSMWLVTGTRLE